METKEPIIETVVKEKPEENKFHESDDFKKEYELIKKDPYNYICDFMEKNLIHVGENCFSIMSLMPGSLILPNIPYSSSDIRSNINLLYISPPESGKSSLCKKFELITYFPLKRRVISSAELSLKAMQMKLLSIIIEDFSQTSEDYETIKVLEGITGEEQNISKSNMKIELLGSVKGLGLFCGTPRDLQKYMKSLEGGLLSRCMVLYHYHTKEQHREIGLHVNNKIADDDYSENMSLIEAVVIKYYKELLSIQEGKHSNIKPISRYYIHTDFKKTIGIEWDRISSKLVDDIGDKYWIRDLQDTYRILVASAFLNIHNRNTKDGILSPNEQDLKLALKIMKQNMKNKWEIMKAVETSRKISNYDMLKLYLSNPNVPQTVKNILLNISRYSPKGRGES